MSNAAAPASSAASQEFALGTTTLLASDPTPDLRGIRSINVGLDATGICWQHGGLRLRREYREIRSLRLECEFPDGDSPTVIACMCTLSFTDGMRLLVTSGAGAYRWRGQLRAAPDMGERQACYVAFVTELHHRLGPENRSQIIFLFGGEAMPLRFRLIFHAIFGCGIVVLPAGAALATGVPFLWLVAAMGGCMMLVSEVLLRRGPRRYTPDAIPRNALPSPG